MASKCQAYQAEGPVNTERLAGDAAPSLHLSAPPVFQTSLSLSPLAAGPCLARKAGLPTCVKSTLIRSPAQLCKSSAQKPATTARSLNFIEYVRRAEELRPAFRNVFGVSTIFSGSSQIPKKLVFRSFVARNCAVCGF